MLGPRRSSSASRLGRAAALSAGDGAACGEPKLALMKETKLCEGSEPGLPGGSSPKKSAGGAGEGESSPSSPPKSSGF